MNTQSIMPVSKTLLAAAMLSLAVSGTGCANKVSVDIPNPLTRGQLVPNRIPNPDLDRSTYFQIPQQMLTNEASMVRLDPQQGCFSLVLRVDGDRAQLAALESWKVFVRADPNFENMQPIFGAPTPPQQSQVMGSIPERQLGGYQTICSRYSGCRQEPYYITVRRPALITLMTGGGSVCFVHGGGINPATKSVTLHLDDPNNVGNRFAFEWRLIP